MSSSGRMTAETRSSIAFKLWFAPDALRKLARLDDRLQGLYAPYWTYDSSTTSHYTGKRGDNYTVTKRRTVTRDGKRVTETYRDTEIRWRRASPIHYGCDRERHQSLAQSRFCAQVGRRPRAPFTGTRP